MQWITVVTAVIDGNANIPQCYGQIDGQRLRTILNSLPRNGLFCPCTSFQQRSPAIEPCFNSPDLFDVRMIFKVTGDIKYTAIFVMGIPDYP